MKKNNILKKMRIAWSFRFPSLNSLSRRKMPPAPLNMCRARPHLGIVQWLNVLDLGQYDAVFERFKGVEDLLDYSEADIKDLGIKNSSHRARIISSLIALRSKYEKGNNNTGESLHQRHSVAVDSGQHIVNQLNTGSDILAVSDSLQSKSLCNLTMDSPIDSSQDTVSLKKALEWELSLDSRDLRSHAWYHGAIPRSRAEEIVDGEGDFLVRDCASQPGNYVLTCQCKGASLHFVINKVVIQPDTVYERVQYQFEDDAYDTVPDLITFYVGSGKHISAASGARIQYPRNRMYPLSFYATKYSAQQHSRIVSPISTPLQSSNVFRYNPYNNVNYKSPMSSPPRSKREPPRLPFKKHRSQSLTPSEVNNRLAQEKCNSADGVIQPMMSRSTGPENVNTCGKFNTHSLPRSPGNLKPVPNSLSCNTIGRNGKPMTRVTSDPALSPCLERHHFDNTTTLEDPEERLSKSPPPKPSRIPSLLRTESKDSDCVGDGRLSVNSDIPSLHNGTLQRVTSYHASGSDSGNGSGDSAQSSAAGDSLEHHRSGGVIIKNPRFLTNSASSTTLKNFVEFDATTAEEQLMQLDIPPFEQISKFDLENFSTLLLPSVENKPLDNTALKGVKIILQESGPRILATHLTKLDLQFVLGEQESWTKKDDNPINNCSGIELCSLPHGHQFRLDLIERSECLKLLVAVTILTCHGDHERAEILHKWIQVAIDTKTALGNLYGFCGIMLGLCMPQIQKLDSAWHTLRQIHTDSAFSFEAKLRPTLKNMNECVDPQPPNTTLPHLLPCALLQERTLEDFNGTNTNRSTMVASCISVWEANTADFGLSTLFLHLEGYRKYNESLPVFRRNAQIVFSDTNRVDDLMMDAFRTEFHLKFMWGSRGAAVAPEERHTKFEQVLTAMSDKCCRDVHPTNLHAPNSPSDNQISP